MGKKSGEISGNFGKFPGKFPPPGGPGRPGGGAARAFFVLSETKVLNILRDVDGKRWPRPHLFLVTLVTGNSSLMNFQQHPCRMLYDFRRGETKKSAPRKFTKWGAGDHITPSKPVEGGVVAKGWPPFGSPPVFFRENYRITELKQRALDEEKLEDRLK